jgi:hypothetical protein
MGDDAGDLISIAAAAKEIGVNRSTLWRAVQRGRVRSHGGRVRLSEVLADRRKATRADSALAAAQMLHRLDRQPLRPPLLSIGQSFAIIRDCAYAGLDWEQTQAVIRRAEQEMDQNRR